MCCILSKSLGKSLKVLKVVPLEGAKDGKMMAFCAPLFRMLVTAA
jgi:hypothetical protein